MAPAAPAAIAAAISLAASTSLDGLLTRGSGSASALGRSGSMDTALLRDPQADSQKPIFHVMPESGWSSDPHGALFWRGRYHLFYQHRVRTCQWAWGLCWNHVVSTDLVHWERLPPALVPTPGGYDADGCFSGSITINPRTGLPVLFYTGARLRTNPEATAKLGPMPAEYDMELDHFESQCIAVPEDPENDDLLIRWKKLPTPWLEFAPSNLLTAWRDPICVDEEDAAVPGEEHPHMMLVCSGYRGKGASTLIYRSSDLMSGWKFDGELASWPDLLLGKCWECPILIKLRPLPLNLHTLPTLNTPALLPTMDLLLATTSAPMAAQPSAASAEAADGLPTLLAARQRSAGSTAAAANGTGLEPSASAALSLDSLEAALEATDTVQLPAVPAPAAPPPPAPRRSADGAAGSSGPLLPSHSIGGSWVSYPSLHSGDDCRVGALGAAGAIEVLVTATTTAVISSDGLGQLKEVKYGDPKAPEEAAAAVQLAAHVSLGGSQDLGVLTSAEALQQQLAAAAAPPAEAQAGAEAEVQTDTEGDADATDSLPPSTSEDDGRPAWGDDYPGCFPPDESYRWFFSISPDACTYSIIYFIGQYTRNQFDLDTASGPYKLDLGNVLYAPTCFNDPKGRHILWGYMRELRSVPPPPCICDKFSYAGCVSLPRVLWLKGDRLFQAPLPEMVGLRTDVSWHGANIPLLAGQPVALPGVAGVHLDLEVSLSRGDAELTSVVFKSFRSGAAGAMAIVYNWDTCYLEVVFDVLEKPRKRTRVYGAPAPAPPPFTANGHASPPTPSAANGSAAQHANGHTSPSTTASAAASATVQANGSGVVELPNGALVTARSAAVRVPPASLRAASEAQLGSRPTRGSSAAVPQCARVLVGPDGCRRLGSAAQLELRGAKPPHLVDGPDGCRRMESAGHLGAAGTARGLYYEDPEEDLELEAIDLYDLNPDINPELRMKRKEAGGVLDLDEGEPLELRIFLDGSSLEIFTGTGEV